MTRGRLLYPERRRAVTNAMRLYESFHGSEPKFVDEYMVPTVSVAMLVGKVVAIEYITPHNRRDQFRHEFKGKARPTLAVSHDGKQLLFVGGEYYFNDHGIIDGSAPE